MRRILFLVLLLLGPSWMGCHRLVFPDLARQASPPRVPPPPSRSLFEKALRYERTLQENHLTPDGLVAYKAQVPARKEEIEALDLPDGAAWTGCTLAAEAFRYAATGEPAARERVHRLVDALHRLQEITGVRGLLARTLIHGEIPPAFLKGHGEWRRGQGPFAGYHWRGDVSNDQYAGVIFGYGIAYDLVAEPVVRERIAQDLQALMDHLVDHGMTLVDVDGKVTTHGDMSPRSWEDLDALLALSFLKTASHVTGSPRFQETYRELIERHHYHRRATQARKKWWEYLLGVNHSDNHLAFLAYYPLLRLEQDPRLLSEYRRGLERTWSMVRDEGNSFFSFIYLYLSDLMAQRLEAPPPAPFRITDCAGATASPRCQAWREALVTLQFFPEEKRVVEVRNSRRRDIRKAWLADRHGRPQAQRPLPVYQRPVNTFEWKANPYRLDGHPGARGQAEYAGIDYLLAYWLGRYHGFIGDRGQGTGNREQGTGW
ncbi:MAG: hypothetical protein HYY20_07095 [Candidatus Tectomicrobia bacterium]|uniref:Uncharacterized protein n=1 Tax=Tectimicrobiota bacterium TaxID=2528274 RepID=A0A932CP17_UNCTE|nr:hypothetical protein [Candidatus Tectomicrobia bacterium]